MNAKRIFTLVPLVATLVMLVMFSIAFGAEELVTGEITQVVRAVDKNGADYTRLIVNFDRELEGQKYVVGLPVMGFGSQAEPAAALAEGDTLKAICSKRVYQDRESYTIISILQ